MTYSRVGLILGAVALLAAAILAFAGPLQRHPPVEERVAGRIATLRDRTVAAVQGRPAPPSPILSAWDIDRIAAAATSGTGALAVILGVIGFVRREDRRASFAAMALGAGAIAFQMLIVAMSLIAVLLILYVVLNAVF